MGACYKGQSRWNVAQMKARLVAKCYAQIFRTDYFDTLSHVAKLTSIQLFISMVAIHN